MTGKELQEELTWKFPHIAKEAPEQVEEAAAFCEGYKAFLDEGKTERECVQKTIELARAQGYEDMKQLKVNGKYVLYLYFKVQ